MILVGLTGTIGAGKSAVGRLFEGWGARRIDADEMAREVVRPGLQAFERIRATWGEGVLAPDGSLDRAALRRIVAGDPGARRELEHIVHPAVLELLEGRLEEARAAGTAITVIEVPLLFETDLDELCDVVVTVDAPLEERKRRIGSARRMSQEEFVALDAAQMLAEEKGRRADIVVENAGSLEELEEAASRAWERIERLVPAPDRAARGRWAVDLHMHTHHSKDCLCDPADVVARALRVGLDRIAITDHDEIEGAFEARRLAPDLVIVGEEVRTAEGLDLIGLFLSEHIPRGGAFREVAAEIHRQGGVTYLPHPFDRWRGGDEEFLSSVVDLVDVVEAFNSRVHDPERNERARRWAERHSLPVGAGSDAHLLVEIGGGRVRLDPFDGPGAFLRSVAGGTIEGTPSGLWVHIGSTWAKIRKRLPMLTRSPRSG